MAANDCACACCVARGDIDWQDAAERHIETIGNLRAELVIARRLLARAVRDGADGWYDDAFQYLTLCPEKTDAP